MADDVETVAAIDVGLVRLRAALNATQDPPCLFRRIGKLDDRCSHFDFCVRERMACAMFVHYAQGKYENGESVHELYHPHSRIPSRKLWEVVFRESDANPRPQHDDRSVELAPRILGKPGRKPKVACAA